MHTGNAVSFEEIVATLDQIMAVERTFEGTPSLRRPVFAVSFALD
jgi:hypothetical protein